MAERIFRFERIDKALEKLFRWTSTNLSNDFGGRLNEREQKEAMDQVFGYIYDNGHELSSALGADALNVAGSGLRIITHRKGREKQRRERAIGVSRVGTKATCLCQRVSVSANQSGHQYSLPTF